MGLCLFFKNILFLAKVDLKKFYKQVNSFNVDELYANMNAMMDNVIYELPTHLEVVSKPKIKNFEETLDVLIEGQASFCRFGDGELLLMGGGGIHFQRADEKLAARLLEIICSSNEKLLIGINYQYYYANLSNFSDYGKFVYRTFIHPFRAQLDELISLEKQYYSAGITSAYMIYKKYDFFHYFKKMKKIWEQKDIAIICGERVFSNIEFNIFDCARSVDYYFTASKNAFDDYEEIFKRATRIPQGKLIICLLGPTAKVLAYDLTLLGYRVLDMGHIAKDYDAYRKRVPKNKETIGKFFQPD